MSEKGMLETKEICGSPEAQNFRPSCLGTFLDDPVIITADGKQNKLLMYVQEKTQFW